MESKWSRFGLVSVTFPNYSWADVEESESEDSDSDSERTRMDYYERSYCSLSADDTSNDENYPSDKSDNGSIMTLEEADSIVISRQTQEERDGIRAVTHKNIHMCTPLAQLVLQKSIVRHAKMKCFYSDDESWTDACDQENLLSCLIIGYPWGKIRD